MKKLHFGKSKLARILSGRGFYVALAVSLLAVGGATYTAINSTLGSITDQNALKLPSVVSMPDNRASSEAAGAVNNPVGNVPITSSTPTAPSSKAQERVSSEAPAVNPSNIFAMPLSGEIISEFSNGELVKSKTLGVWRTHDGIDIKAEEGTPVKSTADGKIIEVKEDTMWGMCVTVEHTGGYTSYYYGLAENVEAKKNQPVKIGDVLGYIGNTASAEMADEMHLHFGIKKDEKWINPLDIING